MTTEQLVFCDGCNRRLRPDEHVTRIRVAKDVNSARDGISGWMWERPLIRASDPTNAPSCWSCTLHFCSDCSARGRAEPILPTTIEEERA